VIDFVRLFFLLFLHQFFLSKALSSQLETILDKEQEQNTTDNNESGVGGGPAGGGANFWNSDESFEDYYNEGTYAWSFVFARCCICQLYVCLYVN
jgi:hypothetical protein